MTTLPRRLRSGDQLRVIAPSNSLADVPAADLDAAVTCLTSEFGLHVTFGTHVGETGPLGTGSIPGRVADLHEAFADPDVAGVLAARGGHQANQLLPHLDYELIAANPKVFCGFSDITAVQAALLVRTGLVTYSGPVLRTFARPESNEATLDTFRRCLFGSEPVNWRPAKVWTNDGGPLSARNDGWWVLQPGTANGRMAGGNLLALGLLRGTPYWPDLNESVLVLEADETTGPAQFAQHLAALLQTGVAPRALLIGRFPPASGINRDLLTHLVAGNAELNGVPVLANIDVGHTTPLYTFPIGGDCYVTADPGAVEIVLTRH